MNSVPIINEENNNQQIEILNSVFNKKNIRVFGTFEEPFFLAKDIGEVLELSDVKSTIRKMFKKEGGKLSPPPSVRLRDEQNHFQTYTLLTEKQTYKLAFRSNTEIANKFQD